MGIFPRVAFGQLYRRFVFLSPVLPDWMRKLLSLCTVFSTQQNRRRSCQAKVHANAPQQEFAAVGQKSETPASVSAYVIIMATAGWSSTTNLCRSTHKLPVPIVVVLNPFQNHYKKNKPMLGVFRFFISCFANLLCSGRTKNWKSSERRFGISERKPISVKKNWPKKPDCIPFTWEKSNEENNG